MYELEPEHHHFLGIALNQEVWGLLDKAERTRVEDRKMVALAHGSLFHWSRSAKCQPANLARGHWMISRVHAVLGQAVEALEHADTCFELCEEHGLKDFDRAYALEALARAHASAGVPSKARGFRERAAREPIADDEDRRHFVNDLATGPWFDLDADRN